MRLFTMPSGSHIAKAILLLFFSATLAFRCAHPVMPTGGDKDIIPPLALGAEPENFTTGFKSEKITIYFDEFIQLKDHRKEVFISPPLEKFPDFKVKGKKLQIRIEEALRENTTYTIYFGNSVVDLTEGNPQTNFSYVFSTGDHIDSLSITGELLDAFDYSPVKGAIVMLYQDNNDTIPLDSLPLTVKPLSASRTLEGGLFRLQNLKAEPYKIFALEDLNSNYIYDLPDERIAFLDTLVLAEHLAMQDTVFLDSIASDGSHPQDFVLSEPANTYRLLMFTEPDTLQRLLENTVKGPARFQFIFNRPADQVRFEIVGNDSLQMTDFFRESNERNDTLDFWRKSMNYDTLYMRITHRDTIVLDTVRLVFKQRVVNRREQKRTEALESLTMAASVRRGVQNWFDPLQITFGRPIETAVPGRIQIIENESDTVQVEVSFRGEVRRRAKFDYPLKKQSAYKLIIADSTFTDITGASHDTVRLRFKTLGDESYGRLIVDFQGNAGPGGQFVVQLMSEKKNVIREDAISGQQTVIYDHLEPANYIVKAFLDENSNGMWDPGDYTLKRQPEKIFFHPQLFTVRANWEVRESWTLP